jgi:hypothetical protein
MRSMQTSEMKTKLSPYNVRGRICEQTLGSCKCITFNFQFSGTLRNTSWRVKCYLNIPTEFDCIASFHAWEVIKCMSAEEYWHICSDAAFRFSVRECHLFMTSNHLKTKRRLLCLKAQFVPRSKNVHPGNKNQSIYEVSSTSRCLFSDKYKTYKYSVGTAYSC